MRIALIAALAASTMFAVPAAAGPGNAYGHQTKVCLLTFSVAGSSADADVVKAQYVPLAIGQKLEARNDSFADIYTYNEASLETGVDFNIVNGSDPALGITADMNTEEVCNVFMDATSDDDGDDD
jgi:hypothetical protein